MHAVAPHETMLRSTAGMGRVRPNLTAWKGVSGRRFVASVFQIRNVVIDDLFETVVLLVRRGADGFGHLVDLMAAPSKSTRSHGLLAVWIEVGVIQGATEVHVHRLAEDEASRAAAVADLTPTSDAAREAGFASSVG